MKDKLLIIKYVKDFIDSIDNIVINYPNKEIVVKNRLLNDSLSILEILYIANNTKDIIKKREKQIEVIAKISMLDYYIERSYKRKYISERNAMKEAAKLLTITNMMFKWIGNESKS